MIIWKYKLELGTTKLSLPKDSKVLNTVQMQNGSIVIWALINEEEKDVSKNIIAEFKVVGTGQYTDINLDEYDYIGTIQDNSFVAHVFGRKIN